MADERGVRNEARRRIALALAEARVHPMGEAGLKWANYRELDQGQDNCGHCLFYTPEKCSMFGTQVFYNYTCDEWVEE